MHASDRLVLEAAYASWAARDLRAIMACFAADVVCVIHLPPEIAFAGEVRGRDELSSRLQAILDAFDFLEYRPLQIVAEGPAFRSQIRFHYVHGATGLAYDGTMRHVGLIAGDKITRFEEFHDVERVRTFFALLQARGGGP